MISRQLKMSKIIDRKTMTKLLSVGRDYDISKGGYFDARSGVVNFWCSNEDRPTCWDLEVIGGEYPRDYVGGLYFDAKGDKVFLELDASPYALIEPLIASDTRILTDDEWESIFDWLRIKAAELFRLADLAPVVVGIKCPFCEFVLKDSTDLLLMHIDSVHEVEIQGFVISEPSYLMTAEGQVPLEYKEEWDL